MTYKLIIRPEAELDLKEAHQWYENQLEGLGSDFLQCIDAAFSTILDNPQLYPVIHQKIQRALIRRFPYGIFYIVDDDTIVVIAVFHASRNPEKWQDRA